VTESREGVGFQVWNTGGIQGGRKKRRETTVVQTQHRMQMEERKIKERRERSYSKHFVLRGSQRRESPEQGGEKKKSVGVVTC